MKIKLFLKIVIFFLKMNDDEVLFINKINNSKFYYDSKKFRKCFNIQKMKFLMFHLN